MNWKKFATVLMVVWASGTAVFVTWLTNHKNALPPILFLGWDEQEHIQLFRVTVADGAPRQLTQAAADILNFAPSPNGKQTAFSTDSEIWLMDVNGRSPRALLSCPDDPCDQIVWHPDGRRLLYERHNRLWWLDTKTGQTIPLKKDAAGPSRAARFSADGNWVSYVVSPEQGIEFYNFADGRHFQIPASLGTPAIWHPTQPIFLYRNQQLITLHGSDDDDHQEHGHDYALAEVLLLASVTDRSGTIISGDGIVDDGAPAWSPDGEWIVFGRKQPRVATGRQLWLVRPDGSDRRALTDDPLIHHGAPAWSPDGRFILYQRFDTDNTAAQPGVWLLEVATGKTIEIAPTGFQPVWLPGG